MLLNFPQDLMKFYALILCINKDAVLDSEITDQFKVYRNDRNGLGGGVFILVAKGLISIEKPEFVTECELD